MRRILPVFFCLILIDLQGQSQHTDSLEVIWQTYFIKEINRGLFKNINHPDSSVYIIYNQVSSDSVYNPVLYKYKNLHIFLYPRSYIMGHNIDHWMVIDSLNFENRNSVALFFRIIYSKDNWIEKNDEPICKGEVYFERLSDSSWSMKKRKIQEIKQHN